MRLAFKNWGFGYSEKEVPVIFKIGTLEDVCNAFKIEFWQIGDKIKEESFDFSVELLWQGYLTACKESYTKPKYKEIQAILWYEHLSQKSQKEFTVLVNELFGKITEAYTKKKVNTK